MARLFNAYVIVDWSAASKPGTTGADLIRIGVLKRDVRFRLAFEGYAEATRAEAEKRLNLVLDDLKKRGERALLGLNFPFGFPRGLAGALTLTGEPWSALWDFLERQVKDKADNTNNRFAVGSEINRRTTGGPFPFWGCPPRDTLTTLQPKRAHEHGEGDLPEFRYADQAIKGASIWKLYYAGSIGGHAILGAPMLKRLRKTRAVKVWPFETGWKAITEKDLDGADALAVEVKLGLVPAQPLPGEAKELAPVRALAERIAKLDETGKLGQALAPPQGTPEGEIQAVEHEEGWILNV
ncbi:MAG TPA: cobalamin biosynthesis protein CbiG [Caulobacteraceae bacterium]